MTGKKINWVLDLYVIKLAELEILGTTRARTFSDKIKHAQEMIPKIRAFIIENRLEKAFRWLGFLQGIFYTLDVYTIEEMANHNRPTKADIKDEYPDRLFDEECTCEPCVKFKEAID